MPLWCSDKVFLPVSPCSTWHLKPPRASQPCTRRYFWFGTGHDFPRGCLRTELFILRFWCSDHAVCFLRALEVVPPATSE
ncbi:4-deoxy-L-threo-5-hexosulose-uronate ketol-isomerase [Clarias magur]|uniref:4-deoxy-L-threo-5-hexosulose-uronate ketol-isomerase n=1 Tax=Clarias magur TaxID=1594786 RepID=A0A8J4TC01_CLAMG|nr:4-deoxy-L-threo-5-hexosulose-uronate ketol-isomerase [Clarias magur]